MNDFFSGMTKVDLQSKKKVEEPKVEQKPEPKEKKVEEKKEQPVKVVRNNERKETVQAPKKEVDTTTKKNNLTILLGHRKAILNRMRFEESMDNPPSLNAFILRILDEYIEAHEK